MIEQLQKSLNFEGFVPLLNLALQYSWCNYIKSINNSLVTVEIGYFRGRTTELALQAGSENHTAIELQYDIVESHKNRIRFVKGSSSSVEPQIFTLYGKVDYMFIDGGHTYGELLNDLYLANKLLKDNGVLIIDDISTYYKDLEKCVTNFCDTTKYFYKVCITPDEMVLCRNYSFETYYKYALMQLPVDIAKSSGLRISCEVPCKDSFNCLDYPYINICPRYDTKDDLITYVGHLDWHPNANKIWIPHYISTEELLEQAKLKLQNM